MTAFDRYSVFPAKVGGVNLVQVGSCDYRSANTKSEPVPGGSLSRHKVITAYADPMSTVPSADLDGVLGLGTPPFINLNFGHAYNAAGASLIQFQRRIDGGAFDDFDNPTHTVLTGTKGYCHITDITASQDDPMGVMCSIDIYHLSIDGLTIPNALNVGSGLAMVPQFSSLFYLADVYVGDFRTPGPTGPKQLKGVQSVRITPGIQYVVKRAGGDPFATVGSVVRCMPEVRITTTDMQSYDTVFGAPGFFGHHFQGSAGGTPVANGFYVKCYFARGLDGGRRVDYSLPQHCAIGVSMGDITADSFSAAEVDDGLIELTLRPTIDPGLVSTVNAPPNLWYQPGIAIVGDASADVPHGL